VFCQVLSDAFAARVLLLLALVAPLAVAQLLQPCALQQADYVLVKVNPSCTQHSLLASLPGCPVDGTMALQLLDGRHYLLRVHRVSAEHKALLQKVLVRFAALRQT
jgi:hypothetical protein